jgi:thiol-disulfide isomerase/thioredoxin
MTGKTSVVTPERFASGLTYQDYISQINVNKERFEEFYESGQLTPEDAAFFQAAAERADGPAKVLVLGEDWCPDVYRGMPMMARIAEAAGIEMRVFPRDQHLDIMDEFLNHGEHKSIPVAVFYDKAHRYITHWIERPASANEERGQIDADVKRDLPNGDEQAIRAEVRARTQARHPAWQQQSIAEMRRFLTDKLGLS